MKCAWLTPEGAGAAQYRVLRVPGGLIEAVSGALYELTRAENWEQSGALTPTQAADIALDMWLDYVEGQGYMIGAIIWLAGALPDNVLACDGGQYYRSDYPLLYNALDAQYRLSETMFVTPVIDSRYIRAVGDDHQLGDIWGSEDITIPGVDNLPAHTHAYLPPTINPDIEGPGIPDIGATVIGPPTQTGIAGQGVPWPHWPPSIALAPGIVAR